MIFYIIVLVLLVIFAAVCAILYVSLAHSTLSGSPYVPSSRKDIREILKMAGLAADSVFLDLGCGDGRVVMEAVEQYHVKGIGVDISPLLITFARFQAKRRGLKDITFYRQSIVDAPLTHVDVIFLFLMPKFLKTLTPHILKNARKDTLIISHGFPLPQLTSKLINKRDSRPFPTFFYRI